MLLFGVSDVELQTARPTQEESRQRVFLGLGYGQGPYRDGCQSRYEIGQSNRVRASEDIRQSLRR